MSSSKISPILPPIKLHSMDNNFIFERYEGKGLILLNAKR